ncbi:recombinase family protein [Paenibacillus xerothermodurans]|uniref:Recombinase family protein n=1 Tax=Paenibacillus xerothermodurans TaxID=1977292 RepID=A0A2W1NAQ9_PAEXE|nr:recombinase family protein [Paenibacillus xerothermodurans]PZE20301.1 recombinase family protein [Paenibacillus xerothermodurans]
MKCAIYARVSTKREEQQNSLQNQIALAESIAREQGFTVVGRYIDNGISGSGMKNRAEILRLLDDAKEKKFDVIIAKSVSRLGRNSLNSMQTADILERIPVRLILPEDNYDTETSKSRFMFNLKVILSEEENSKFSERIKLGLKSSAEQGKRRVSVSPYGYTVNPLTKNLEVDETAAPILKEIFWLYLHEGWGMFKISNYLSQKGVLTPRATTGAANAGTKWQQNSVKLILNNPVYTGKLIFHREETTGTLADSELYKIRRKIETDKQIVIENAHPALISENDFIAVQELMKRKGKHKSNGKESLFSYIVKCPDCGSGMHFKPDRRNGAYVCGGYVRHTSTYCSSHIIEEQKLLQAVKDDLKTLIKDNVRIERLYGLADEKANALNSSSTKELKRIDKQLAEMDLRFDKLLGLHAEGVVTTEQFKHQNERIALQQQDLANKKTELHLSLKTRQDLNGQLQVFRKEVERFANLDIDGEQVIKQVLQRLIHKIEVFEGGKIKIQYNLSNLLPSN